jgi:hypothetical protein
VVISPRILGDQGFLGTDFLGDRKFSLKTWARERVSAEAMEVEKEPSKHKASAMRIWGDEKCDRVLVTYYDELEDLGVPKGEWGGPAERWAEISRANSTWSLGSPLARHPTQSPITSTARGTPRIHTETST